MSYTAGQALGGNPTATFINAELQKIEVAFGEYLSRIETAGNQMEEPLDMNGHPVLNALTDPGDPTSLVSYQTLRDAIPDVTSLLAQLQGIMDDIASVQIQFSSFGDMIDANNNSIQGLQTDVTDVQSLAAANQSNIAGAVAASAAATATVAGQQQAIADLMIQFTTLDSLVGVNQSTLQNVAQQVNALQIAAGGIQDNAADIQTLQTLLSLLQTEVDTFSDVLTDITALQQGFASVSTLAATNQANVSRLASRSFGFSFQDVLPDNTVVARYVFSKPSELRDTGAATAVHLGHTDTPATTGDATFEILKNGVVFGTVLFAPVSYTHLTLPTKA